MKRQYEGNLSEENVRGFPLLTFNFKHGGRAKLERLFDEFYGENIRITIETFDSRDKVKAQVEGAIETIAQIQMEAVICPA